MRKLGDITTDLEKLYEEMIDGHDMQFHEILAILDYWCRVHRPDAFEFYTEDGSSPVLTYGPRKSE